MMIPAPEMSRGTAPIAVAEKTKLSKRGNTAMRPKKEAPKNVSLFDIFPIYSDVCVPGLIPGM